jgi:hypothetical protein
LKPVAICHRRDIVDTGGKFATGINNASETGGKFAAGVVDTSGNFDDSFVDTGGKFANGVVVTGCAP